MKIALVCLAALFCVAYGIPVPEDPTEHPLALQPTKWPVISSDHIVIPEVCDVNDPSCHERHRRSADEPKQQATYKVIKPPTPKKPLPIACKKDDQACLDRRAAQSQNA